MRLVTIGVETMCSALDMSLVKLAFLVVNLCCRTAYIA